MKGDFSRNTFRPERHYSGVRLQQGRVQVDADWNEQVDIAAYHHQVGVGDVVGACGVPMTVPGFAVASSGGELVISAGRMYVDGILCENDTGALPITAQPDLPGERLPTEQGRYLAYIDVWTRHLTALEQPSLREVALGGADHATRTHPVWQVRLLAIGATATCPDFGLGWRPPTDVTTGKLRAQATPAPPDQDECTVPPGAGFRRLENQLYRVQIHKPGNSTQAAFLWSRDNGTVVSRLTGIRGLELTVADPGRDATTGFAAGQFVELSDETRVLRGEPGVLVRLTSVQGTTLEIDAWPGGALLTMADFGALPTVRRWDSPGALPLSIGGGEGGPGEFTELEDGVEVQITSGMYRVGDYWTIPARTLTGDVDWPQEGGDAVFLPPEGIEHHYCPLGILELTEAGWRQVSDCRELFPPLTELTGLCYVGGDGQEALPDVTQPGDLVALPRPIEVGVANGEHPVAGALVRFTITEGNGALAESGAMVTVPTGADGIAAVPWEVDSVTQVQRVTAELVDAVDQPHHVQIRFSANLSVAARVAYDPKECAGLSGATTVQSALERVTGLTRLYPHGGDGQEGRPGTDLSPLQVVVANDCGPVEKASVEFTAVSGGGTVNGQPNVTVLTNASGIASVTWRLGPAAYRQQVTAKLAGASGRLLGTPQTYTFNANASVAAEVAYDPRNCANLAGVTTVQGALDKLCGQVGGAPDRVIRVTEISLPDVVNQPLHNDDTITPAQLAEGILIFCDERVDKVAVRFKPVVQVILDLPFPITADERSFWGAAQPVGTTPLILGGRADSDNEVITWNPDPAAEAWLRGPLNSVIDDLGRPLLAHLVIKGNVIWSEQDPDVYLDGDLFGRLAPGTEGEPLTHERLPSGDGRRGGDLELWFNLALSFGPEDG